MMMHGEQQHILFRPQNNKLRTQQRRCAKIGKRCAGSPFCFSQHGCFPGLFRHHGEIDFLQWHVETVEDDLDRFPALVSERGTQYFVAGDQLVDGPLQRSFVKFSCEAQSERCVVEGIIRLQRGEEPEALLGEGEGQCVAVFTGRDRRRGGATALCLDGGGLCGEGRVLEDQAEGDVCAEGGTDAGEQLRCQQGMPAALEEIVVPPDGICLQHIRPEAREQLLARCYGGAG